MLLPLWQMEQPLGQLFFLFYFILCSEKLNRTSFHMWGRWYLPIFLFMDGLLTHMYIDSFISLMRFWSSLPTTLKFSSVVVWHVVLKWSYIGEGAFRYSLNLSQNVLEDSPMCSSSHSTLSHLYLYMMHICIYDASYTDTGVEQACIYDTSYTDTSVEQGGMWWRIHRRI